MERFQLGARLMQCADMVRLGVRLADIGTDHAYLPVWLAKKGRIAHAVAADVNPLPLQIARQTIHRYGMQEMVSPLLSDGLSAVFPEDADDIVLAGMGGELMIRILSAAPWIKEGGRRLILQPMTSAGELRCYLAKSGFSILREEAVREGGRLYTVMLAAWDPEHAANGPLYPYIGALKPATEENRSFLLKQAVALEKRARGLELAGSLQEAAGFWKLSSAIREFREKNGGNKMLRVQDIYREIDVFAPFETAMDFDNVGLLAGDGEMPVHTVLLSLDITPEVIREAVSLHAELIISHHPVIFTPLRRISTNSAPWLLARHGIAAICAHTNLDMAQGGVNTCLANRLGLHNVSILKEYQNSGLPEGLVGEVENPRTPAEFAALVKEMLGCDGLKYTDGGRVITRAAICGGSGAQLLQNAAEAGAQALVTADTKHNQLLDAVELGITLVDAGHFYTEDVVIQPLLDRLQKRFPELSFIKSGRMRSPARFL